jgi:hypothetical protein
LLVNFFYVKSGSAKIRQQNHVAIIFAFEQVADASGAELSGVVVAAGWRPPTSRLNPHRLKAEECGSRKIQR